MGFARAPGTFYVDLQQFMLLVFASREGLLYNHGKLTCLFSKFNCMRLRVNCRKLMRLRSFSRVTRHK